MHLGSVAQSSHPLWVGLLLHPPRADDGIGQLTRGAFRINDMLLNPYFSEPLDYKWIVLELRRLFQKWFQPIDKSKRDVTNSEIILLYLRKVSELLEFNSVISLDVMIRIFWLSLHWGPSIHCFLKTNVSVDPDLSSKLLENTTVELGKKELFGCPKIVP